FDGDGKALDFVDCGHGIGSGVMGSAAAATPDGVGRRAAGRDAQPCPSAAAAQDPFRPRRRKAAVRAEWDKSPAVLRNFSLSWCLSHFSKSHKKWDFFLTPTPSGSIWEVQP